jgi:transposase
VRLRAQLLRLSHRGSNIQSISSYTGRSRASVGRDLDPWAEQGFEGLFDGTAPGNPARITQEARTFMEDKLSEERTWNATQLAEALGEGFGVEVTPEAVRQHLISMGYGWATHGNAPVTCPTNPPIPRRSVKPGRSWKG